MRVMSPLIRRPEGATPCTIHCVHALHRGYQGVGPARRRTMGFWESHPVNFSVERESSEMETTNHSITNQEPPCDDGAPVGLRFKRCPRALASWSWPLLARIRICLMSQASPGADTLFQPLRDAEAGLGHVEDTAKPVIRWVGPFSCPLGSCRWGFGEAKTWTMTTHAQPT